jgi:hypothetical protein
MKDEECFKDFKFCCNTLRNNITLEENRSRDQVVMYHMETRMFSLPVIREKDCFSPIAYCPYCGKKFPDDLSEEWWETINEELGKDFLEDAYCPKRKELPEEFLTDEWWKKRGL